MSDPKGRMASQFDTVAPLLCDAIESGATIEDACRAQDVKVATIRTWLSKGRAEPSGRYGDFAAKIDAGRAAQVVPSSTDGLTRAEWEELIAKAARAGSVPAMKLWSDTHHDEPDAVPADPFREFDELAARRNHA